MTHAAALEQMIGQQVRTWDVLDPAILDAMRRVPRELFVPAAWRSLAYADCAPLLAHGKRMLPPMLVGRILLALQPQGGEQVLEVGTGSGYLTACLGALGAQVRSLEVHDDLAARARKNLRAANVRVAEIVTADGMQLDERERYDCVVLTASLPLWQPRFAAALRAAGRLFAVVGTGAVMEALLVTRDARGELQRRVLFETSLEPLEHAPAPAAFSF